jgi:hypothetical protein
MHRDRSPGAIVEFFGSQGYGPGAPGEDAYYFAIVLRLAAGQLIVSNGVPWVACPPVCVRVDAIGGSALLDKPAVAPITLRSVKN